MGNGTLMATPSAGRSGESGEESEQNSGPAGPGPLKAPLKGHRAGQ